MQCHRGDGSSKNQTYRKVCLMKNVLYKGRYYLLNGVSLGSMFVYYFLATRALGFGEESDTFFAAIAITTFASFFLFALWEGFTPHYVRASSQERENFVARLLPLIVVGGVVLSGVLVLAIGYFKINQNLQEALGYTLWLITPLSVIAFSKAIFLAHDRQLSYYGVDIALGGGLVVVVVGVIMGSMQPVMFYRCLVGVYGIMGIAIAIFMMLRYAKRGSEDLPWETILTHSALSKGGSVVYGAREMILVSLSAKWGGGIYTLYAMMSRLYAAVVALATTPTNNSVVTVVMNDLSLDKKVPFLEVALKAIKVNVKLYALLSLGLVGAIPLVLVVAKMDPSTQEVVIMTMMLWLWYVVMAIGTIYGRLIPLVYAFGATIVINTIALLGFVSISIMAENWIGVLVGLVVSEGVILAGYYLWLRRVQ